MAKLSAVATAVADAMGVLYFNACWPDRQTTAVNADTTLLVPRSLQFSLFLGNTFGYIFFLFFFAGVLDHSFMLMSPLSNNQLKYRDQQNSKQVGDYSHCNILPKSDFFNPHLWIKC